MRGRFHYGGWNNDPVYVIDSTVSGNRAYGHRRPAAAGSIFSGVGGTWGYVRQSTVTLNQAEYGGALAIVGA